MEKTPIFVISYNRGGLLEQVLKSYSRLCYPIDIIIHDNGSDDPLTLRVLDECEQKGITVARAPKIFNADDLEKVDETVQAYFRRIGKACPYVVTDCDIDLSIASPKSLIVYRELLDIFSHASVVGPMLRIKDIPAGYPMYARVMNLHIQQFWRREPKFVRTSLGLVAYQNAYIDSTFGMHRAEEPYTRLKKGIRVYHPYEARHLDWYSNKQDLLSHHYGHGSARGVSHWSNAGELYTFEDQKLKYGFFKYVEEDDSGALSVRTQMLPAGRFARVKQSVLERLSSWAEPLAVAGAPLGALITKGSRGLLQHLAGLVRILPAPLRSASLMARYISRRNH